MMIDKLDPMAVSCERKKAKHRDLNVGRSSLSFVGLGDDPFGMRVNIHSILLHSKVLAGLLLMDYSWKNRLIMDQRSDD